MYSIEIHNSQKDTFKYRL